MKPEHIDAIQNGSVIEDQINGLPIWTIYCDPRDYPGQTVARLSLASSVIQNPDRVIVGSLAELRARFESMGLVCLGRAPIDDACIIESWI